MLSPTYSPKSILLLPDAIPDAIPDANIDAIIDAIPDAISYIFTQVHFNLKNLL
jgi:hypothetical protein